MRSTKLGLRTRNGDTMSTNTSRKSSIGSVSNVVKENAIRKSSIGIFSTVSIDDNTKEYTCRKSSIGSLSNVSLANNKEDILQGTYAKCYIFTPFCILFDELFYNILWQFSAQWWVSCWVYLNKISNKNSNLCQKIESFG